jgi:hypothetical protein
MRPDKGNILFENRSTTNYIGGLCPDNYVVKPAPDFVLCRNAKNVATAVYGKDVWDFNPYRLSAKQINKIKFKQLFDCDNFEFRQCLIEQVKYILYQIMYFAGSGRTGRTSASTLIQYKCYLSSLGRFCVKQLNNDLAFGVTIFDVLSNVSYMSAFLSRVGRTEFEVKMTSGLLSVLGQIDSTELDFKPCSKSQLDLKRKEDKQHPVIPSRIYIEMMVHFDELIAELYPLRENIKNLIISMADRYYGAAIATQASSKTSPKFIRPTMIEAIAESGLKTFAAKHLPSPKSRHAFVKWITDVQYIAKSAIHFYTGMRDQETARIKYNCVEEKLIDKDICDENNNTIDASRMVSILSTTTKFTGYQMSESWLAPDFVIKAIDIAKAIAEGLSVLHKRDVNESPLFLSPYIIRSEKAKYISSNFSNLGVRGNFTSIAKDLFRITETDLSELSQSDPDRDFSTEETFNVGCIWPVTFHQYRRSLAFYASNSGFVSLSTVTQQYKQLSRMMAQYYARGNENFLPIFSTWDEKNKQNMISKTHVAYEFQLAVPTNAIQLLFQDVFADNEALLGSTGSFMEKQKARIENGELSIFSAKEDTLKMANAGELSYRETLLGGCLKVGPCDDFLLGEITSCLPCHESVIKVDKLLNVLNELKIEINSFDIRSAEYQILSAEISKLEKYKQHKIIPSKRML